MNYYNTTNLEGQELKDSRLKSESQEKKILNFFKEENQPLSPFYVWRKLFRDGTPLTSVRRSITNLAKDGLLVKTTIKVMGIYGKPNYMWKING